METYINTEEHSFRGDAERWSVEDAFALMQMTGTCDEPSDMDVTSFVHDLNSATRAIGKGDVAMIERDRETDEVVNIYIQHSFLQALRDY